MSGFGHPSVLLTDEASGTTATDGMILFSLHGRAARLVPADGSGAFQPANVGDEEALRDLAHIGFLRLVDKGAERPVWRWSGDDPTADRALLALLAQFDLHLEIGMAADDTVWIAVAAREPAPGEAAGQAFSGSGFRPDDAVRACLGEFGEFQSWLYRPDDRTRRCRRRALGEAAIDPWLVLGFDERQRERWLDLNDAWRDYDFIPHPTAFDGEIDWSPVNGLADGSTHWLPSQVCFGRYADWGDSVGDKLRSDSNGCAAGRTSQHALAQALLELVERDATGIWWYGRVPRPGLPRSLFDGVPVSAALAARERMRQGVWLLDLTNDLEIPVVAAILADNDGNLLALGFGCCADRVRAASSAYCEMCQLELSVAFARRRVAQAGKATAGTDRRLLDWLSTVNVGRLPHMRPGDEMTSRRAPPPPGTDADIVDFILQRLRRAELEAHTLDLERADIGVPAVRAFVPGLCHFKPRIGFRRLVDVPRALGWREADFDAKDLSDLPLLL